MCGKYILKYIKLEQGQLNPRIQSLWKKSNEILAKDRSERTKQTEYMNIRKTDKAQDLNRINEV